MKKFYLTITLLLATLCTFLMLYSFGLFRYGMFATPDDSLVYAKQRKTAVNQSPYFLLAVLGNYVDQSYISETAVGIGKAALMINIDGGILGKNLKVRYTDPKDGSYATRLAAQKNCEREDVAYLIGPVSASRLREVRSLTQFHALPALAPFAPLSPDLPVLSPDIFGSLFPIHLLFDPLIAKLKEMNCRNLLFISGDADSYSAIFTNMLTGKLRQDTFFNEIHRINFVPPVSDGYFRQPLKQLYENTTIDAIVFTDTPENLQILGNVMRELQINLPVFGNDQLDVSTLPHFISECEFPLYYVSFTGDILPEETAKRYSEIFRCRPSIKEQLGIVSCLLFRDAVTEMGVYDPVEVGKKIKKMSADYFSNNQREIKLTMKEVKPAKQGAANDEK